MAANWLYNQYLLMPTGDHGRAWLSRGRVHGPQASYRAELMGVAADLAPLGSTIALDNKVWSMAPRIPIVRHQTLTSERWPNLPLQHLSRT